MTHYYRTAAALKRGQFRRDNAAPPEDGPTECAECSGTRHDADGGKCPFCNGLGWTDENGYPWDPAQAERDRDDMQADQHWQGQER